MAVLIEPDGKETVGGITQVRDAFVTAGLGMLVCTRATMEYDHSIGTDAQVLKFIGHYAADGEPFAVVSDPVLSGGALAPAARAAARRLVEAKGAP